MQCLVQRIDQNDELILSFCDAATYCVGIILDSLRGKGKRWKLKILNQEMRCVRLTWDSVNGSFLVKYNTCSAMEPINDFKSVDNGVSPVYLFISSNETRGGEQWSIVKLTEAEWALPYNEATVRQPRVNSLCNFCRQSTFARSRGTEHNVRLVWCWCCYISARVQKYFWESYH